MKKKQNVINIGCRLNSFESSIIKRILDSNTIKNKVVVNTCAVTNQAVKRSISAIKKAKKINPDCKIYVTGCASEIDKDYFSNIKEIDKIIPNRIKTDEEIYALDDIEEILEDTQKKMFSFPILKERFHSRTRALLQIQQGCNHRCTFCIIPYGRGNSQSLPIQGIIENVNKLLSWGYKEIVFTGVDITSYGNDLPGKPSLGNTIRRVLDIQPKLKRIRFSSIDPAEIDDELFNLFSFEKRVLPHIHLSVQAGDNLILKRMKRRHSRENLISLCNSLRKNRPELTFGADLIVGFPTEDNKNFMNTFECVKECLFSNMHIFPFSPKKNTPASKMPQVSNLEKIKRVKEMQKLSIKIKNKILLKSLGKEKNILFENEKVSYSDEYLKVSVKNLTNKQIKNLRGKIIKVLPFEIENQILQSKLLV